MKNNWTIEYTLLEYIVRTLEWNLAWKKCVMLVMKSGKQHLTNGLELPNQDEIRTLGERETYKYLVILEVDTIKQVEKKGKIQKEYLGRTRKLHETKLTETLSKE